MFKFHPFCCCCWGGLKRNLALCHWWDWIQSQGTATKSWCLRNSDSSRQNLLCMWGKITRKIKGEAAVLLCNVLNQISFTAFLNINKYLRGIFWAVLWVNSISLRGFGGVLFARVIVRRRTKSGIRTTKLLYNWHTMKYCEQIKVMCPNPEKVKCTKKGEI